MYAENSQERERVINSLGEREYMHRLRTVPAHKRMPQPKPPSELRAVAPEYQSLRQVMENTNVRQQSDHIQL